MLAAVGLQIAAVAVSALVAVLAAGWESARFLMLGGAAAVIPNALFALRLTLHRNKSPESYPVVFFLGMFVKIGLTLGLLAWIIKTEPDIRWLPLLLGLIIALKAPLFALLIVRQSPPAPGEAPR
ncbi:MAG: ATP synthase subunit I [Burkholderiaceae bacterium]